MSHDLAIVERDGQEDFDCLSHCYLESAAPGDNDLNLAAWYVVTIVSSVDGDCGRVREHSDLVILSR